MYNLLQDFTYEDPDQIIKDLAEYTSKEFYWSAQRLSEEMLGSVYRHNRNNWIKFAREYLRGPEMYRILQSDMSGRMGDVIRQMVGENAYLISSTPLEISQYMTKKILEESQMGIRPKDIAVDLLLKLPDLVVSRANLIARTEVSKSSTALIRAQSQEVGINWYIWRSMKDIRVRRSHKHMEDIIVSWSDPPSPESIGGGKSMGRYAPGEIYNCRCYAEPIVSLDYVQWPHKVYQNGHVSRMRKIDFERTVA